MASKEANDLAAYLIKSLDGQLEAMKLQKLMYYCNGWSLAYRDEPMFGDRIEAWRHGPVVKSIYEQHRGDVIIKEWPNGCAESLSGSNKTIADIVLKSYGGKSGWQLRNMTHEPGPWLDVWGPNDQRIGMSNEEITLEAMKTYFRKLRDQHRATGTNA